MSIALRSYLHGLLALILTVSSLQMAVARNAPMAVDQMVICSGDGSYTVSIDAEGNPTEGSHHCPDCVAAALEFLDVSAPGWAKPAATSLTLEAQATSLPVVQAAYICPLARGPPLSV